MQVCCWRSGETGAREVVNVFDIARGVGIVSRWGAGKPYRNMGGCSNVVQYAKLADGKVCTDKTSLVALVKRVSKSVE